MLLGAFGSDAYNIVLVLHILCGIVGFGAVFLNGIYGQQAGARKGSEGLAISESNRLVSTVGEYFIYAVFLLGVALVLIGDDRWGFGDTWIWLSMVSFLAAIGVSHGMLNPRVRKMLTLQRELVAMGGPPAGAAGPPTQVTELERLGKQVGILGTVLNVVLVLILFFMVFQP